MRRLQRQVLLTWNIMAMSTGMQMPRYSGLPVLVGFGLRMLGIVGMRCKAADDVRSMELLLRGTSCSCS